MFAKSDIWPKTKPTPRHVATVITYSVTLYLMIGFGLTFFLQRPPVSMVVAAMVSILYGAMARSVLHGVLRTAVYGFLSGLGMVAGLLATYPNTRPPDHAGAYGWVYALSTAGLCAVIGGLFAHLGRRNRSRWDRQWDELTRRQQQESDYVRSDADQPVD